MSKMSDYDRENLAFLLNADPDTLRDWYYSVGPDDHKYASELLAMYSEQLQVEAELIDMSNTEVPHILDAAAYLRKYTLG